MFEIDPKVFGQIETALNIKELKFIIGFTDEYFVISKRSDVKSDEFKYTQDPLQDGESPFYDIWNFCVIKLSEGGHLLQFQSLRGKDKIILGMAPTAYPPPPPHCPNCNPWPWCNTRMRFGK